MGIDTSNPPASYTTDEIRQYVSALPVSSQTPDLSEKTAQAVRSVLSDFDPASEKRLHAQIDTITKEVIVHLDQDPKSGRYVITMNELRGIIAQTASRVSSQCAIGIGQALSPTAVLGEQFKTLIDADAALRLPQLQEDTDP